MPSRPHPLLLAAALASLGTAALLAAIPSIRLPPAITTTTAPAPADILQADQILSQFPFNALLLVTKGQNLTIEGRVLEVRDVKPPPPGSPVIPNGVKPGFHVILVGTRQNASQLAHITCDIDPASLPAARALKLGSVIRITGTGGDVLLEADRVELLHGQNISALPDPPVYTTIVQGSWRGTLSNPAGLAAWRDWAHFGNALGGIAFDLRLAAGSKARLIVEDARGPLIESTGRWSLVHDAKNGLQIYLVLSKLDPVFVPVSYDGQSLKLGTPAAQESPFAASVTCSRIVGRMKSFDQEAVSDQLLSWLKANVTLPDPTKLMADTTKQLFESIIADNAFTAVYGSGLLKSKKTTQVCLVGGKFMTFELTDAQVQRSGMAPNQVRTEQIRQRMVPMVPEVKVDALELDDKDSITVGKEITGHITMRSLRHAPNAQYSLAMENLHGIMLFYFNAPPSADSETFEFKLPKPAPVYGTPNPLAVIFTICRIDDGVHLSVSEPIVKLMDVNP